MRRFANWVNLSTPLGLAVARAGRARVRPGPWGLHLADRYRWGFPVAGAFTVGDVVLSRHDLDALLRRRPHLLEHEEAHSRQWAWCLGLPFLPLYLVSMVWSWLRTGDRAARCVFERRADLAKGGYADVPPRPLLPVLVAGARRACSALLGGPLHPARTHRVSRRYAGVPGYTARDQVRWVAEDASRQRADRAHFARDRARVLHSAGLRRLALTTQVVQPGSDDFVRNRLTHSLEVAQIGREFGAALGCDADVVDTACLAHDLGHPPFGHHGESVLDALAADIGGFEGNAQTLRVLTRLEAKRSHPDGRSAGLNLTRASLDAVIKYPWSRSEAAGGSAKCGYYDDDAEVFAWIRQDTPAGEPRRRCLEAEVMDWSDDVAYCVHDVEDAIASRRIDPRALRSPTEQDEIVAVAHDWYAADLPAAQLAEALDQVLATGWIPTEHDGSRGALAALKDMTSELIGHFVHTVELATRARHGGGVLTRYAADLVVPDDVRAQSAVLKATAAHFVMLSQERRSLKDAQHEVVAGLVDHFGAAPTTMDPMHRQAWADAERAGDEAAARRAVLDQVASLSDARAIAGHPVWQDPAR